MSSTDKPIFLHNWFLVGIAEKRMNNVSNDSTAQVSLGGFTTPDLRDKIQTAPVKARIEKQLLRTVDGMEVRLVGFIDRDTSYHNGFSIEVINLFYAGFPFTWNHVIDLKTQQHLLGSSHTEKPECLNRQVDVKNNMEDAFLHRDGKNSMEDAFLQSDATRIGKCEKLPCKNRALSEKKKYDAFSSETVADMWEFGDGGVSDCKEPEAFIPTECSDRIFVSPHKQLGNPFCSVDSLTVEEAFHIDDNEPLQEETYDASVQVNTKQESKKQDRLSFESLNWHNNSASGFTRSIFMGEPIDSDKFPMTDIQETEEETCQNAELPQVDKGLVTASPKCMADHKLIDVTPGGRTYFTRSKMIKGSKAHSNRKRKRTSPLSSSLLSRNPGEDDINHTSSELNFDNCERTRCLTKSKENGNSQAHVHEFSLMLHPPVEEKLLIEDRVDDSSGRFVAEGLDNNISSQGNNTAINTDGNIVRLSCQNNLFIDSSSFGEAAASSNHNLRTFDQRSSFSLDTSVSNKSHLEKHKIHTVEGEEKKLQTPTKRQESLIPPPLPSRVKRTNQEVSKAFGLKTSKSGRLIVPPLAHWRSQRIMHDMDGGIIAIFDGSQADKPPDSESCMFTPPTQRRAIALQKRLCAAAETPVAKKLKRSMPARKTER